MTTDCYYLSVVVYGRGDDPKHRCHWAIALHHPHSERGTILQVTVMDIERLWYQFDRRDGVTVQDSSSEGLFTVAHVEPEKSQRVVKIIASEEAPRNGIDRCQDWIFSCMIALEVEELVPDRTSALIQSLVALPLVGLIARLGDKWKATKYGS